MWTFEEAISEVRLIGLETAKVGWYACLGGGVLHKGYSSHDLDIVFIPHHEAKIEPLYLVLKNLGLVQKRDVHKMQSGWRSKGLLDEKHVEEWRDKNDRRIDIILMKPVKF